MTRNSQIRTYVNKIMNRITFRIKAGYDLELLTSEMINLLGSTRSKITKNENIKKCAFYFIVILLTMIVKIIQEPCIHLYAYVPSERFGQLSDISPTNLYF